MQSKFKILDIVLALATIGYGLWLVAQSWPSPTWWSIAILGAGIVGLPLAIVNPLGKVERRFARKFVKKA